MIRALLARFRRPSLDYWDRPNRRVVFTPHRRDDLKPEVREWVDGEPFEVEFMGTMDMGAYDGQLMWSPVRGQGPHAGWFPDCDLTDVAIGADHPDYQESGKP